MSVALPIAALPFSRRGACPSLDQPMRTGDGLLARLRIAGGRLSVTQFAQIAQLAQQYGNGFLEITSRGNLQVRGLTKRSSQPFSQAVRRIVEIETGLVVETPPLAGDDPGEICDPRPIAAAIRSIARPLAKQIGPKVTVIVDGGGQISLAGLKADIRLVALAADRWAVSIADDVSKDLSTRQALDLVAGILQQLANLGSASRAADLAPAPKPVGIRPASSPIGTFALQDSSATGIALPFGSATADASISLANAAAEMGIAEFRLAPCHSLLAIDPNKAFTEQAAQLGFLTKPHDPRTRISACIGSDGCASGHVPARAVAARLAPYLPANDHLHVSGCAKGCAHPRPAGITLVGRADGYGLVIGGKAGDTPQALMQADQLESTLAAR